MFSKKVIIPVVYSFPVSQENILIRLEEDMLVFKNHIVDQRKFFAEI